MTPIAWRAALSLAISGKVTAVQKETYPDLKILILDLDSCAVSGAASIRFVSQFPGQRIMAMPWVRLLQPGKSGRDNLICNIIDPDLMSMKAAFEKDKPDMYIIKNIWAASLTMPSEPGDHHAIANLVGPQLIFADDKAEDDLHLAASRILMAEIGLLITFLFLDN